MSGGERHSRRRWRRWVWAGGAVVVVVWGAAVALVLWRADQEVRRGLADAQQARSALSNTDAGTDTGSVVTQDAVGPLRTAHRQFSAASSLLDDPLLDPLDVVPVVGRQLGAVRMMVADASGVSQVASGAAGEAQALLDTADSGGEGRVVTLERLAQLASSTHRALDRYRPASAKALVGPVAAAYHRFSSQYDQAQQTLATGAAVSHAVAALLQGPSTDLVLASNNAEMRAGSGTFLDASILEAFGGRVVTSDVTPTPPLALPPGAVPVAGDLAARWGWLGPSQDWRMLGLTPQFDVTGALAAEMWARLKGQHVDGVLSIDVVGLRDLLEVTGPVTTDKGVAVDAQNVEQLLLHDEYANLGSGDTPAQLQAEGERQDMLGSLANAVVHALDGGGIHVRALAKAVARAAGGRHLLAWSSSASTEAAWIEAGVGGTLTPDAILTGVVNLGGNKLDQYLAVSDALHIAPAPGGSTRFTLSVNLRDGTPPGQSQYIGGPFPGLGTVYGQYVGLVALNLPGAARDVAVDGDPSVASAGPEGPTTLVAVRVSVMPGSSTTVTVHFDLPLRHGSLRILPSGRTQGTPYVVTAASGAVPSSPGVDDATGATVRW